MNIQPASISVVIPVWKQMKYLSRALDSVIWQLGPADEAIVVDDASPEPDKPLPSVWGNRVLWIENEKQSGECASRNEAIRRSHAEWVKFLDADDVLAPFALDTLRNAFEQIPEHIHVITGGIHRIVNGKYADYLPGRSESIKQILRVNPMLPSATLARRRALLEAGLFDERIEFEGDWEMWLRLHERYGLSAFAVMDQPIAYYWLDQHERSEKKRHGTVDGRPVREYLRERYGAQPAGSNGDEASPDE